VRELRRNERLQLIEDRGTGHIQRSGTAGNGRGELRHSASYREYAARLVERLIRNQSKGLTHTTPKSLSWSKSTLAAANNVSPKRARGFNVVHVGDGRDRLLGSHSFSIAMNSAIEKWGYGLVACII
jgi:hypothetical protein